MYPTYVYKYINQNVKITNSMEGRKKQNDLTIYQDIRLEEVGTTKLYHV